MKKILALGLVAAMSVGFTGQAVYNNWNNSPAYDKGYQMGYIHGKNSNYSPPGYGYSELVQGYEDGYQDGMAERSNQYGYY